MKVTTSPYDWTDHQTGVIEPGIRIANRHAFVWVPYSEIYELTNRLVDLTEKFEQEKKLWL